MAKKSNLINETLMYSVDKAGGVVMHHLPYARGNPLLEIYTAKGFTYERPAEKVITLVPSQTIATPAAVTLDKPTNRTKRKYRRKLKAK